MCWLKLVRQRAGGKKALEKQREGFYCSQNLSNTAVHHLPRTAEGCKSSKAPISQRWGGGSHTWLCHGPTSDAPSFMCSAATSASAAWPAQKCARCDLGFQPSPYICCNVHKLTAAEAASLANHLRVSRPSVHPQFPPGGNDQGPKTLSQLCSFLPWGKSPPTAAAIPLRWESPRCPPRCAHHTVFQFETKPSEDIPSSFQCMGCKTEVD